MAIALPFSRKKNVPVETFVVAGPSDLQVPSSSFDFSEGAFSRAERTRRIMMGITLTALVGFVWVGGLGLRATAQAADSASLAAVFEQQAAADNAQIALLDTAGGYTSAQLRAHNEPRAAQLQLAEATEAANADLIAAVFNAAPAGMEVQTVSIAWTSGDPFASPTAPSTPADPGAAAGAGQAPGLPPTGSTGSTPTAPGAPAGAGSPTLSITARATAFSQIAAFNDNLAAIPGVSETNPTWTGGGDSWTVSISSALGASAQEVPNE